MKKIRLHKLAFEKVKSDGADFTRPEVQRNIEKLGIRVNGKSSHNRMQWVYTVDQLDYSHWPERYHGDFAQLKIFAEHKDYYVILKPPGIVVEPGAGHQNDNLLNWLVENFPTQRELGVENKFGLINRLDKDTQGLLLVAKNTVAYNHFKLEFKNRNVTKKYLTVLEGRMDFESQIQTFNTRDKHNPIKQKAFLNESDAASYDSKYRNAESAFYPLGYLSSKNQTLVEVDIFTGRMHQIRLHAQILGHPLSHDPKYGSSIDRPNQIHVTPVKDIPIINFEQSDELISQLFLPSSFNLLSNYLSFTGVDGYKNMHQIHDIRSIISELRQAGK